MIAQNFKTKYFWLLFVSKRFLGWVTFKLKYVFGRKKCAVSEWFENNGIWAIVMIFTSIFATLFNFSSVFITKKEKNNNDVNNVNMWPTCMHIK